MSTIPENIYYAMRSLFRFMELSRKKTSTLVIENERTILKNRMAELDPEEMIYLVEHWEKYYNKELVNQEIKDEFLINQLKDEFKKIN